MIRVVRVLFVSDLHIEDNNKYGQLSWMKALVRKYRPDMLLSAGDNGELLAEDIEQLKVQFYTIYGNHDRPEFVQSDKMLSKYWLADGLHVFYNGLRILAWNGIFGFRTDRKRKWYHRSLDDAVRLAFKHQRSKVDIFISHEVPWYQFGKKRTQEYLAVMNFIVKMVKPKVWLNGHMHLPEPVTYDVKTFKPTVYVRVDSRVCSHGYAVIDFEEDDFKVKLGGVKQCSLF